MLHRCGSFINYTMLQIKNTIKQEANIVTISHLAKIEISNLYNNNITHEAFIADIELINTTKQYADYYQAGGILSSAIGYAFAKFIIETDELMGDEK